MSKEYIIIINTTIHHLTTCCYSAKLSSRCFANESLTLTMQQVLEKEKPTYATHLNIICCPHNTITRLKCRGIDYHLLVFDACELDFENGDSFFKKEDLFDGLFSSGG